MECCGAFGWEQKEFCVAIPFMRGVWIRCLKPSISAVSMIEALIENTLDLVLDSAPLPLCSCGVLPAAVSLSRAGAFRASTTSFLISTPETGVDSVALSWVMLGPIMALLRPFAAILSAISAGLLVGAADSGE